MKIKTDIVTGFLGSGKTAFINALIDETMISGEEALVVQMEDGRTKIKKSFSGVVSYFYNDDVSRLDSFIYEKIGGSSFDRIIIEYNGTESFDELQKLFRSSDLRTSCRINDIFFVADRRSIKSYVLNMGEMLVPSIENSSLVLLNNCTGTEDDEDIVELIKGINISGHILKSKSNEDMKNAINESGLFSRRMLKRVYMNIRAKRN